MCIEIKTITKRGAVTPLSAGFSARLAPVNELFREEK